jgi:tyrosyl-tRNA synthetase
LLTRWQPQPISEIESGLKEGRVHPMLVKKQLAFEIVSSLQGEEAARIAEETFSQVHQLRKQPALMPEFKLKTPMTIVDLLVQSGLSVSKSEARRLINQNGVKIDGEIIHEPDKIVATGSSILQKGRNHFLRMV